MEMTAYNNYRITPGRWNPLTPEDLLGIQAADVQLEQDLAHEDYLAKLHPTKRPRLTDEERLARLQDRRRRYWQQNKAKIAERRKVRDRERYHENPEKYRAIGRERYAAKKNRPADVAAPDRGKDPNHQQYNTPSPKMQPVKRPGNRRTS